MFITLATDMALRRQTWHAEILQRLIDSLQYQLIMQQHDDRERIVIPYGHPSLMNRQSKVMQSQTTRDMTKTGFVMGRYK